ncbi:hypothetical protein [Arthrobacter castelli]|uniref:hypothetical protein n=1 Tax=Arthrobacter castelli TaxID=271431 RepID=UPI0004196601|nr:hypothetical protein [Arthrobacter castelli]
MSQKPASSLSDNDLIAIIVLAVVAVAAFGGAIAAFAAGLFNTATEWAIDHGLMVAANDALVPIGTGGLDAPRIFVAASAVVIFILAATQLKHRTHHD